MKEIVINSKEKQISKFLSLILRHNPKVINILLDDNGWANVNSLIDNINKYSNHGITMELLEKIVDENDKSRFIFNEDKTLIRANQGHSISVDVNLKKEVPPNILYHGTVERNLSSIMREGLLPQKRLYVHLSLEIETANKVGQRHGKPIILTIDADRMLRDGYPFYLSENNVWLTKTVPSKYISE